MRIEVTVNIFDDKGHHIGNHIKHETEVPMEVDTSTAKILKLIGGTLSQAYAMDLEDTLGIPLPPDKHDVPADGDVPTEE